MHFSLVSGGLVKIHELVIVVRLDFIPLLLEGGGQEVHFLPTTSFYNYGPYFFERIEFLRSCDFVEFVDNGFLQLWTLLKVGVFDS